MCDQDNAAFIPEWQVCRVCLSTSVKLYPMKKYNLFKVYEKLTGIDANRSERLPHCMCWECSARLLSAIRFRSTALRSHALLQLLYDAVAFDDEILPDVSLIDRHKNNLASTLSQKIFDVNHMDYHFTYAEPILPEIPELLVRPTEVKKNKPLFKRRKVENVHKLIVSDDNEEPKVDKRRKAANEEIFEITDLSLEEQVQEIENRRLTENYTQSNFKCDKCYKGFVEEGAYKCHMIRHTDKWGTHECALCMFRFKTPQLLKKHIATHMQRFSCKKCSFVATRPGPAKLHEEYHNGTRYQCPHCPEDFVKITTYMGHIRMKHPSDFVCPLCGYSFVSAKGIILHKKLKHSLEEEQIPPDGPTCNECDVQFLNKDALERHLKLSAKHGNDTCNRKRLSSSGNFQEQTIKKQKVTEVKKKTIFKPEGPITCEQCGIQLPDSLSYYSHFRRTHPDKNRTNYPSMKSNKSMCEVCGRMFQTLALLQDHSFTHSDDKQFACSQCDKRFQRKYRLIVHDRRIHSRRQQHACDVCGSVFSTASNLQRHMVSHTGLKPFSCEMCDKCFKHATEKKAHVSHVHLKKPRPKCTRGKRKTDDECATQPVLPSQPTDIADPVGAASSDAVILLPTSIIIVDQSMY